MPQLKILNNREKKDVLKIIEKQWNAKLKLEYVFLKNNKNRIFIVIKDIDKIDFSKLRVNSIGMYFCDLENEIRLSIEGSQIVGPKATHNVVEINDEQTKKWLQGNDLEFKGDYSGFLIIKNNNDFLGTGKYKDGKVLNYISKSRRVNTI